MHDLHVYQYLLIGLVFIWSGFVRSGLGFGGAVLSLPFLLLIVNDPLVFLPLIAVHLLVFASLTIVLNNRRQPAVAAGLTGSSGVDAALAAQRDSPPAATVDWPYLWKILGIMIVPKIIGVLGLITLPPQIMSIIIFCIVTAYAISYILDRPFKSNSPVLDTLFLMLGGYISGTSLIGAPLIVAVVAQHLDKAQLRDTLYALWIILVSIKIAAFIWAGVDMQLIHHMWLLPCAGVGHVIGLRFHQHMIRAETKVFFRWLGSVLLLVSAIGLWNVLSG
ncbi:MAG: permease [unclassified Hahellaceae]|nr:permease [Hahellaceae bacterium]|tara:strand:- start:25088 stop:25918 length:831 start_codon:yes stop_codon:yes gene_type:complete